MSSTSSLHMSLLDISSYATPEEAIDGVLKETEAHAKHFSSLTRAHLTASVSSLAHFSKEKINKLATEAFKKIHTIESSLAIEQDTQRVAESWRIAKEMRMLSLSLLQEASLETRQFTDLKNKIQNASLTHPLVQESSKVPAHPLVQSASEAAQVFAAGVLGYTANHYVSTSAASIAERSAKRAVWTAAENVARAKDELKLAHEANLHSSAREKLQNTYRHLLVKEELAKTKHAARLKAREAMGTTKLSSVLSKATVAGVGSAAGWVVLKSAGGAINLLLGSGEAH